MLHVKCEDSRSSSFIEEDIEYLFSSVDGGRTTHAGYISMATAYFGPGELKMT